MKYQGDVIIVGAGIAGLAAAIELLDAGRSVVLLDRDEETKFGGLTRESFGGIFFVGTPQQRRMGFNDTPDLALQDWISFAEFGKDDVWPRKWAEQYINACFEDVYLWLKELGVRFFPVVHWVERGLYTPGNSGPRFHMVWGTGEALVEIMIHHLREHPNASKLQTHFRHHVRNITLQGERAHSVAGADERTGAAFEAVGEQVIIASGGICGDIERLKKHWYTPWGSPPETILNGSHRYADGDMHDAAARLDANVTHLDIQWNYAAGVHHPRPDGMADKGLSLVPPRSALWLKSSGERFGPMPLVAGFDTRYLVEQVCRQPKKYSWLIMNRKIAEKELAVSGSQYNDAIRDQNYFRFLKNILLGNPGLVDELTSTCPDFLMAESLEELVDKMNGLAGEDDVELHALRDAVERYDENIDRGKRFHNDEQLRRIAHLRRYRGDRVRTCNFQKILDAKAKPLIAVRAFILSRKSLGGIQTDLDGRVLTTPVDGRQGVIEGLYAIGEAAGFGGGGVHGMRALEGTFLGTCMLGGRLAARSIISGGGNSEMAATVENSEHLRDSFGFL